MISEAKNNPVHVRTGLFLFAWLGVLAGPGVGFRVDRTA